MLGRPQGCGMCESHVSNPQTVGKCCSLLNSLLPPSLLPAMPPAVALSFGWTALQSSTLACCSLMRVCVHARVRACACPPFSTQEVSTERLPARLRLELPLPADSFYANTKSSTTHIGNLFDSLSRTTKTPAKEEGCSLSPFLCVFISVSRLPLPLHHKR